MLLATAFSLPAMQLVDSMDQFQTMGLEKVVLVISKRAVLIIPSAKQ